MSRVDVIIPCYRYGHFLRACVESVLSQEGAEVRALVIDDASPDQTPEVAGELVRQDSRVEYRRHAINQGHIATYNEGLDWATGDFLLLLSADDLLVPGALARAVRLLEAHSEVGMCFGPQVHFTGHEELCGIAPRGADTEWQILSGDEFLEMTCSSVCNIVPTCAAVVRTKVQRAIGGYRSELPHAGDMEMWLRFAAHAPIGKLNCCQGLYRQHEQNMSRSYYSELLGDMEQRKAAFDLFFQHYRNRVDGADRLEAVARRGLADEAFWCASDRFEQGNAAACQRYLSFALDVDPALRSSWSLSRLRLKRALGARLWLRLRPIVHWLRQRARDARHVR